MTLNPQLKNPHFYFMVLCDVLIFVIALIGAHLLRFELSLVAFKWVEKVKFLLLWVVPLKSLIFFYFDLYRGMWRYTGLADMWQLVRACFLSSLLILAVILYVSRFEGYSRSVFVIDGVLTFILTGGLRFGIRNYYLRGKTLQNGISYHDRKNILVIGAGDAGEKLLRELLNNYQLQYKVVGLIDDNPQKHGWSIHGVRVLGSVADIAHITRKNKVTELFIAIPSATGSQLRNIVDACMACKMSYKVLPSLSELIDGRISVKALRDIRYEDILGRPEINLDVGGIHDFLANRTVLITGCGGSIGSELCRQVVKYEPRFLVMLDASEANLFHIQMEIQDERSFGNCRAILGLVQDEKLMDDIFSKYKPEVVFHAAAYKHVPMLEKNPWEAVFNNVIGSRVVMETSVKHGVEKFVLVSTDKAVRPTNVMGASKRVTELIMQSLCGNGTYLMAVRFGNVIGSSGSVVPLFRRQIERGGPVTVTHPEINRYFMTIPEAAQMILQAGSMGRGGEVFVLRMGTPIKIADMARDLIRLSGRQPDTDIKIIYTGLRDGEKLYEELISEGENILPTGHEKVMVLRSNHLFNGSGDFPRAKEELNKKIDGLVKAAEQHDAKEIKVKLQRIVEEYVPYQNKSVL